MRHMSILIFFLTFCISNCESPTQKPSVKASKKAIYIDSNGSNIKNRFLIPSKFERPNLKHNSFAYYLQNLPLKPHGSKVYYFNKEAKHTQAIHAAVLDIDTGNRDLQQCADAVMRLRAEHLYQKERFDDIHFNFTNGFEASYSNWRVGRKYLDMVFSYAGTLSLSKELKQRSLADLQIGDVFIQGGSPGHAVIVVDMAIHKDTQEKIFLLAQSYMPAQDIHVLKNRNKQGYGPWYTLSSINNTLTTPEWTFQAKDLKSF